MTNVQRARWIGGYVLDQHPPAAADVTLAVGRFAVEYPRNELLIGARA